MKNIKKIFLIVVIILLGIGSQTFAESGYAVSFGLNENLLKSRTQNTTYIVNNQNPFADATDTINNATEGFKALGYTSFKYINPTYTRFHSFLPDNKARMLESDIVLIVGHGAVNEMRVNKQVWLRIGNGDYYIETNTGVVGTNSVNWDKTKLVILMGCNTGSPHPNPERPNITQDIAAKGNTVLGWAASIYDNDCSKWIQKFNTKLAENKTVKDAINYANLFLWDTKNKVLYQNV